jgi:hypothetical protein
LAGTPTNYQCDKVDYYCLCLFGRTLPFLKELISNNTFVAKMEGPGHCHSLFCQRTVQVQKELKQMALSLARV